MADSPYVFHVGAEDFDRIVIQGSHRQPVLVDFWAGWCQPCQILMPVLTRLAADYQGAFVLAKVDTEAHPDLATRYGVRGIPAVKLFKDGELVDEFTGALPETEIRAFLDRHIPRESEQIAEQALAQSRGGEEESALALARKALAMDPANPKVVASAARVLTVLGKNEEARRAIEALSPADRQETAIQALLTELELNEAATRLPDADILRGRLAEAPDDSGLRFQLAQRLAADGRYEEAFEQLLTLMRKDPGWSDQAARKTMIKLFDTLGDDPLVARYRGKMASLLH